MTTTYTPAPDEENSDMAQELLARLYGFDLPKLEEVDEGPCEQYTRRFARARVLYGNLLLCRACAQHRARVAAEIEKAA